MSEKNIINEYRRSVETISASDAFKERTLRRMQEEAAKKAPAIKINRYVMTAAATAACAVIAVAIFSSSPDEMASTSSPEKKEAVDIYTMAADAVPDEVPAQAEVYDEKEMIAAPEEEKSAEEEMLPGNTAHIRTYDDNAEELEEEVYDDDMTVEEEEEVMEAEEAEEAPQTQAAPAVETAPAQTAAETAAAAAAPEAKPKKRPDTVPAEEKTPEQAAVNGEGEKPQFQSVLAVPVPSKDESSEKDKDAVIAAGAEQGNFYGTAGMPVMTDGETEGALFDEEVEEAASAEELPGETISGEEPISDMNDLSPARLRMKFKGCSVTVTDAADTNDITILDKETAQQMLRLITDADDSTITTSQTAPTGYSYIVDMTKGEHSMRFYVSKNTVTYRTADQNGIVYVTYTVSDTKALADKLIK